MENHPTTHPPADKPQPDVTEKPKADKAAQTAAADERVAYLLAQNVLGLITSDQLNKELTALLPTIKVPSPLEQFQTPEEKAAAKGDKPQTAPIDPQATAPGSMPHATTSTGTGPAQHVAGSDPHHPAGGDPHDKPR